MDSVGDSVWEDGDAPEKEENSFFAFPVKSHRADARSRAAEHKDRMRRERQDENRPPPNANRERQQAMKMAAKPRLQAVAERSPRLSEMAQARFPRVASMQHISQRPAASHQGACRSPRNSNTMQSGLGARRSPPTKETPRGAAGGTSPRQGRSPLQAVSQTLDNPLPEWPPFDASVVYQPRSSVSSFAQLPGTPHLQSRQMSRCASADVPTMASSYRTPRASNGSFASNASLNKLVANTSFGSDAEFLRSRYMQSVTSPGQDFVRSPSRQSVTSPARAPSQDLARSPSHDASVALDDYAKSLSALEQIAHKNSLSALERYAQQTSMNRHQSGSRSTHSLSTSRGSHLPQQRQVKSRAGSPFWVPPPEAAMLCNSMKSPSFLLNCRGEGEAAAPREFTTDSDLGLSLPQQAVVGSSSHRAVLSAVCAFLPPSPSLRHREARPSGTSFSHVPSHRSLR